MNDYELMTILHPRLNADEVSETVAAIEARITDAGGELLSTDVWGRRRLSYPIQHLLEGTYVLFTFNLEPSQTRGIESWLRISESVLRHLLVRGIIPYEQRPERGEAQESRERPAPAAEAPAAEVPATEVPAAEPARAEAGEAAATPAETSEAEPAAAPEGATEPAEAEAATAEEAPAESAEERRQPAATGEPQSTSE